MHDDLDPDAARMPDVRSNIGRNGRAWTGEEARERWELTPERFEMDRGMLFWDETGGGSGVGLTDVLVRTIGAEEPAYPRKTHER